MNQPTADPREESSQWYGREEVADRYVQYQTPGTSQFRHRSPERRVLSRLLSRLSPSGRVLDMPCGTGRYLSLLAPSPAVTAADLSMAMVAAARDQAPHRDFSQADLFHLPFADAAFDLVLCMRFIHHVPDGASRQRCLAELSRVCRDRLICSYFERRSVKHAVRRFRAWRPVSLWRRA